MSGIFKCDSIYKSGGGGGGYKDGGQLVDGDFIKVENNTISSYDNVSRDPVNFYFEVKDGEVLNSVVELTTAVNATINVYVVKNGFYYLLGNIGGDTVTAGENYNINITGNSYAIEQVSGGNDSPIIFIGGIPYKVALMNNIGLAFTAENLNANITGSYAYNNDASKTENGYGRLYRTMYVIGGSGNVVLDVELPDGWRIPTQEDWQKIRTAYSGSWGSILSDHDWSIPGTNSTGLNLLPSGDGSGPAGRIDQFNERGSSGLYFTQSIGSSAGEPALLLFCCANSYGSSYFSTKKYWTESGVAQIAASIRLCKDM